MSNTRIIGLSMLFVAALVFGVVRLIAMTREEGWRKALICSVITVWLILALALLIT